MMEGIIDQAHLRGSAYAPARATVTAFYEYFGLTDRGVIEPGRRADLALIDGDPINDITATRQIKHVWCAGTESNHG